MARRCNDSDRPDVSRNTPMEEDHQEGMEVGGAEGLVAPELWDGEDFGTTPWSSHPGFIFLPPENQWKLIALRRRTWLYLPRDNRLH